MYGLLGDLQNQAEETYALVLVLDIVALNFLRTQSLETLGLRREA